MLAHHFAAGARDGPPDRRLGTQWSPLASFRQDSDTTCPKPHTSKHRGLVGECHLPVRLYGSIERRTKQRRTVYGSAAPDPKSQRRRIVLAVS